MSTLRVDSIQDTAGADNQGKILQVVNSTTPVARHTSTSTVFIDTGFSVSITPNFANSKILIDFSGSGYASAHYVYLDIYRNGTTSLSGDASQGLSQHVDYYTTYWQSISMFCIDSPNTTSAVTYNLFAKTVSGQVLLGSHQSAVYPNGIFISATEIAQ